MHAAGALLLAGLLGGCNSEGQLSSINPVDWWHGLEGGEIAQARPPPPNADAPYPALSTVPPKPPPPNAAQQAAIANALVADRANAHYDESIAPIPSVPPPAGPQAQPKIVTGPDQPNAALPAANAPPPRPAPVTQVKEAPLPAPAAPPAAPAAAATPGAPAPAATPAPTQTAAATPDMPAIPAAPPPPPQLSGVATPPAVTAPTVPPVAPPAPPPVPKPNGPPIAFAFATGSATLPEDSLAQVKLLATQRGTSSIAVTGFGEATSSDPGAQAAALPLALNRARAIATQLMADGVPGAVIRIAGEPQGSGATARLVN